MSGKYALIIGNTEYVDPGLAQLTAPGKDTEDFARVLGDKEICAFDDVKVLLNQVSSTVSEAVDDFFDQKKPDDLLLLYFSGHGVRDELGALYLAVKNTNRFRLRSTAIKSDFIREAMDQSRSKRQVLIMDCCNSGAFAQGTKAATGVSIGTATAFEAGYGRIILTASDSTQFAWEGDKVIGETDNSLFTHFLVDGLGGAADLDGDGSITVDELYDYAYEKVRLATPKQTPSKFSSKQQGEIVLRQNMRIEDIKPAGLPAALLDSLENPFSDVRLGAVQQLIKLLNGKNLGLARAARETLERIAEDDDSRTVSRAAFQAVETIRQAEQLALQKAEEERLAAERKAKEEAERLLAEQRAEEERKAKKEAKRLAALKAKEERLARERAEADRKAKEEAERLLAAQKAEEERKAREETERIAIQKAEQERLAREKAEAERKAKEEAERLLAEQKAAEERKAQVEGERKAKEKADRLAKQKAEEERRAKEEAERLKALKAERERLATEKANSERKVREEAERLLAQQMPEEAPKAKEEAERRAFMEAVEKRLASQRAEKEKLEKEAAEQKAKENAQRLAENKAEAERQWREEAQQLAAEKEKREKLIQEKSRMQPKAASNANAGEGTSVNTPQASSTTGWIIVIAIVIAGILTLNYLPGIFGGPAATEAPIVTEPPATELLVTEQPTEASATEAPATEAPATEAEPSEFFDAFDDNSNGWTTGPVDNEYWVGSQSIDNGFYVWDVAEIKQSDFVQPEFIYSNSIAAENFDVSVDALRTGGTPGNFCYGIIFRYSEGAYYVFQVCDNQIFRVRYYSGTEWESLIEWTENTSIRSDEWNRLQVVASGSQFDLYVNDQFVETVIDDRLTQGDIGLLISLYDDIPGQVYFDNFQATEALATEAPATEAAPSEFFDAFDDNSNGWEMRSGETEFAVDSTEISGGVFIWDVTDVKSTFVAYESTPIEYMDDYFVSVNARRTAGDPGSYCYGLAFRVTSVGKYLFEVCDSQTFTVQYHGGNGWEVLHDWTTTSAILTDDWNSLAVQASGSHFQFYINGENVAELDDTRLESGGVLLAISVRDTSPGQIWFDDFYVGMQ